MLLGLGVWGAGLRAWNASWREWDTVRVRRSVRFVPMRPLGSVLARRLHQPGRLHQGFGLSCERALRDGGVHLCRAGRSLYSGQRLLLASVRRCSVGLVSEAHDTRVR
jgi:hypothetical protein